VSWFTFKDLFLRCHLRPICAPALSFVGFAREPFSTRTKLAWSGSSSHPTQKCPNALRSSVFWHVQDIVGVIDCEERTSCCALLAGRLDRARPHCFFRARLTSGPKHRNPSTGWGSLQDRMLSN
jgi:hypothetical protein